jgi:DNA-binding SARP family transcriptional activator
VEFRVLGPLEVLEGDRSIPLGGTKQRSVLALLLLARGAPVSSERLIDEIWEGRPPPTAQKSVQIYVSGLRKALGEGRIVTRDRGYALRLEPSELDLERFEALVARASSAAPMEAAETLREALALFRGLPLADLVLERWAAAAADRIEGERLTALERRIDADLELGRYRGLCGELERLLDEHPFRERFRAQLMLALYRSGRQGDALEAYRKGRVVLTDELGIEPSRMLQELEQRMLRQDPTLDVAASEPAVASPARPPPRRRRGWELIVFGAAIVLAAAVAALVTAGSRKGHGSVIDVPPGVALLDAKTGRLIAQIGTSTIQTPVGVIGGSHSFWVWNVDPFSLIQIEPSSGRIVRRITSPFGSDVGGYLPIGRNVWFTGKRGLVKVDTGQGREVARYALSHGAALNGLARGAGSLWVANHDDNVVLRVDPTTGVVQGRIRTQWPEIVVYGNGAVWATSNFMGLRRIDPATNQITASVALPSPISGVTTGGGFVWATNETKGSLYKIDPSGQIIATYQTGEGAQAVSFAKGVVWVANQDVGTVTGIDAATEARHTYRFGHPVQTVAASGGRLLVALGQGLTYEDRILALKGQVAKIIVPISAFGTPDPALAQWPLFSFEAEKATCIGLLSYPDAPGLEGLRLQPELARSLPTLSRDGRTYTFTVRPGYRFSPPSNAPVTAQTVRFSIERAFSSKLSNSPPAMQFLSDLKGAAALHAGAASHIAGIRVRGDAISFTIRRPSPDFLKRLSLPYFCPVPMNTPLVAGGVQPIAPPSAGPYYMTDNLNGEYMILKRNPNYHGSRPHHLDAIAFREGVDAEQAVARVQSGRWDMVALYENLAPVLAPHGDLARKHGAASDTELQYRLQGITSLGYVALNAGRPPFSDPSLRRAVAAALNRPALSVVWAAPPTDRLLPPSILEPRGIRTTVPPEPDLRRAHALIRRRHLTVTMAVPISCDPCVPEYKIVRATLGRLGIRLIEREVPGAPSDDTNSALSDPTADIGIAGCGSTYPDPASFLREALTICMRPSWLPALTRAALSRLAALRGSARDAAALRLADRLAKKDVPIVPFGYRAVGALLSPRLGCRIWSGDSTGPDLAALCLRSNS